MNLIYTKKIVQFVLPSMRFFFFKFKSIKLVPWVQNPHTYNKHNCKYEAHM